MTLQFDPGDRVWFYGASQPTKPKLRLFPYPKFVFGYSSNQLTEGKVILEFLRHGEKQYVIATDVPGIGEEMLYVRSGNFLSDDPKKPIGLYRNLKRKFNA